MNLCFMYVLFYMSYKWWDFNKVLNLNLLYQPKDVDWIDDCIFQQAASNLETVIKVKKLHTLQMLIWFVWSTIKMVENVLFSIVSTQKVAQQIWKSNKNLNTNWDQILEEISWKNAKLTPLQFLSFCCHPKISKFPGSNPIRGIKFFWSKFFSGFILTFLLQF